METVAGIDPDDVLAMEGCDFCLEFGTGGSSEAKRIQDFIPEIADRVLYGTPDFVIVPSLGQFVEGLLLVLPREHVFSMARLNLQQRAELRRLISLALACGTQVYGPNWVIFENGAADAEHCGGCCMDHAHLHLVPTASDLRGVLSVVEGEDPLLAEYPDAGEALLADGKPYMYVRAIQGEGSFEFLRDSTGVPGQYLRRRIAEAEGKPDLYDWSVYGGGEELAGSLRKLRPHFARRIRE